MASSPEQTSEQQEPQQQSSSDQEKFHNMQNGGGAEEGVVDSAAQDSSKAPAGKSSSSGKIFIGGLSWETTTEKLTSHFKKYGEIIDSVIMKDRITGHPRGFGFVTYSDPSVCDRVMKDKHVLDGRTVEIKKSVPRESMVKGPRTKKIFVGGIPPTITEDEFKKYFTRFGTVVESQIMQDRGTGRSRGFGFVTFDTEQVVEDILLQGRTLELGGKQVEIKKAEPKKPIEESTPAYGPSYGRGEYGMGAGDYGGYGDGYSSFGGDTYRSGGGYGARGYGGRYDDGYGSGYYSGGGSMGAYGGGPGSYGGLGGGGYGGSMMGRYGDADLYGGMGYGGYGGVDFGGYGSGGSYGGGYGGSRYGGGSSSGRYHPYGRH